MRDPVEHWVESGNLPPAFAPLRVESGPIVIEAVDIRRVQKRRLVTVRLYGSGRLLHSDVVELGSAEARASFVAAAQSQLVNLNGVAGADLLAKALELDELVHRDEMARRGRGPYDDRPLLDASDQDLARITDRTWRIVSDSNERQPFLFSVGGLPSRIEIVAGAATIRVLTPDRLRHHLARIADWRHEGVRPALPPMHVVRDMLAQPNPPLPPLERLVSTPVFAADGSLLTAPGYHRGAAIYYEPRGLVIPPIPEMPTDEDVRQAVATLHEPIAEFPYTGAPELAHALAFTLLPYVRALIAGPTPLHVFEKPASRTGAGLLVSAVTLPPLGRPVSVMTAARDDDEWRKRITAALLGGPAMVLIDNVRRLDSEHLAAVLTAWPSWSDRPMGVSELREVPNAAAWAATGINPSLGTEMAGRVVRCRLDRKTERPWDFQPRISRLLEWVGQHRDQLVAAALTLARAWLVRGRPAPSTPTLPGFEAYCYVVGGILELAGVRGFLGNRDEVYELADAEGRDNRRFVGLWWEEFVEGPVSTAELLPLAERVGLPLRGSNEHGRKVSLGARISDLRDRRWTIRATAGDIVLVLTIAGEDHGVARWRLVRAAGVGKDTSRPVDPPEKPPEGAGTGGSTRLGGSFPAPEPRVRGLGDEGGAPARPETHSDNKHSADARPARACPQCEGTDFWRVRGSRFEIRCRRCDPPGHGAEAAP